MGENQGDKGGFTQLIDNLLIVRGKEFTSIGNLEKKAGIGQGTLRDACIDFQGAIDMGEIN